jgi:hypothetical protein
VELGAVEVVGAVASGVVVVAGGGAVEGVGEGVVGVAVTGGVTAVVGPAAGGGAAVCGTDGTAPAGVWVAVTGGATGVTATVAPVFTPAPVALREVTDRSGVATTLVRWRTTGSAEAIRVVVVVERVVAVWVAAVWVAAGAAASAGGVFAARLAPPALVVEVEATEVAGAAFGPPGVRTVSPGRVAYQPAAARAAMATRPTTTAAGAMERSRRTVVRRPGVATKASSPFGLIAVSRVASSVMTRSAAKPPAAPVIAALVVAGSARAVSSGSSRNMLRRAARFFLLRSHIGVGANMLDSDSGVGSPPVRV